MNACACSKKHSSIPSLNFYRVSRGLNKGSIYLFIYHTDTEGNQFVVGMRCGPPWHQKGRWPSQSISAARREMLLTPLLISLVIMGVMTDTETQSRDDVRLCLLQSKFHHPPSGECHQPLEQGPCDQAVWSWTFLDRKPNTEHTVLAAQVWTAIPHYVAKKNHQTSFFLLINCDKN